MTRYRATFSNGYVAEIANSKRNYTHAWVAEGKYTPAYIAAHNIAAPHEWRHKGFAGSKELADRNMATETRFQLKSGRWGPPIGTLTFSEIVPVERSP